MKWWEPYLAIPFESKGRSCDGCDCYGLLRLIYHDRLSVDLPMLLEEYDNTLQRKTMNDLVQNRPLLIGFEKSSIDTVQPLDVLVIRQVGFDCHLGIVVSNRLMIHSESGKGTVLEEFNRPHIRPRVKEVWRYVG